MTRQERFCDFCDERIQKVSGMKIVDMTFDSCMCSFNGPLGTSQLIDRRTLDCLDFCCKVCMLEWFKQELSS